VTSFIEGLLNVLLLQLKMDWILLYQIKIHHPLQVNPSQRAFHLLLHPLQLEPKRTASLVYFCLEKLTKVF